MRDEAYIHPLCVHGEAQARWGHDLLRGPLFSQVDHLFCLEPRQYDSSMNTWHKEKEGKKYSTENSKWLVEAYMEVFWIKENFSNIDMGAKN